MNGSSIALRFNLGAAVSTALIASGFWMALGAAYGLLAAGFAVLALTVASTVIALLAARS